MIVLGVNGSMRGPRHTQVLVERALAAAAEAGAETRLLHLRDLDLPIYDPEADKAALPPDVARLCALAAEADALIVGSPEYHGSMSGATKNFFDFLYEELHGKLVGLVSATGASMGTSCIQHMRQTVQYCHGWTLPYQAAAPGRCFDKDGELTDERVKDRLGKLGRDVVVYGRLLRAQHQADLDRARGGLPAGFAGWHI